MQHLSLVYMAKPSYGGWVTFTAHLSQKYDLDLYKIGKRTENLKSGEPRLRNYGYGVKYQNMSINDLVNNNSNILITAIDKNYYKYLDSFPDGTKIVIHDPTEVKGKSCQKVIDNLPRFQIFTIRKTVQKYLMDNFNLNSQFLEHPFYEYPKTDLPVSKKKNISATSRIDFDKHTDIILRANRLLPESKKIDIYGAKNDLYIYHHITNKLGLKNTFDHSYKGTFAKSFTDLDNILSKSKMIVDLSAIKNDGGGSQYTFLEAIYQGCVLVLNKKWVEGIKNTPFVDGYNCLLVENEDDLKKIISSRKYNLTEINNNARDLLLPHVYVDWSNI